MAAPRTAGVEGTLAGHMDLASLTGFSIPESGGSGDGGIGTGHVPIPESSPGTGNVHGWGLKENGYRWSTEEMSLREAVTGSSFTATGGEDAMGGSLSFWGRGSGSSLDGREGAFSLDGDATTAMLGADYARDGWLLGVALLQSDGEGIYADSGTGPQGCPGGDGGNSLRRCGADGRRQGGVESSLTAAVPCGRRTGSVSGARSDTARVMFPSGPIRVHPGMSSRPTSRGPWRLPECAGTC